jgi:hypothetical protein
MAMENPQRQKGVFLAGKKRLTEAVFRLRKTLFVVRICNGQQEIAPANRYARGLR